MLRAILLGNGLLSVAAVADISLMLGYPVNTAGFHIDSLVSSTDSASVSLEGNFSVDGAHLHRELGLGIALHADVARMLRFSMSGAGLDGDDRCY